MSGSSGGLNCYIVKADILLSVACIENERRGCILTGNVNKEIEQIRKESLKKEGVKTDFQSGFMRENVRSLKTLEYNLSLAT